jgi:hypothetical protein
MSSPSVLTHFDDMLLQALQEWDTQCIAVQGSGEPVAAFSN